MTTQQMLQYQQAFLDMPFTKECIRLFGTRKPILLLEKGGSACVEDLRKPNPEAVKVIRKIKGLEVCRASGLPGLFSERGSTETNGEIPSLMPSTFHHMSAG